MPRKPKNVGSRKPRKTPFGRPPLAVENGGLQRLTIRVSAKWLKWAEAKAAASGKSVSDIARRLLGDDDSMDWLLLGGSVIAAPSGGTSVSAAAFLNQHGKRKRR